MTDENIVEQVDGLSEEVKALAIDLAIYLAKAKADGNREELNRLEPDFISLVNGAVKVVQQLSLIVNAAKTTSTGNDAAIRARESVGKDQIEIRLRSILDQCARIQVWLERTSPSKRPQNG